MVSLIYLVATGPGKHAPTLRRWLCAGDSAHVTPGKRIWIASFLQAAVFFFFSGVTAEEEETQTATGLSSVAKDL